MPELVRDRISPPFSRSPRSNENAASRLVGVHDQCSLETFGVEFRDRKNVELTAQLLDRHRGW
ncbi:MAG: hypothetical protein E7773_03725 [Sphingomonas sp.]|nr:MAG: hypothetical protein E7773_03725 [Sphingomonas sp.]